MSPLTLWVGNDNPVRIVGLHESINAAYQNNLTTVTGSVVNDDGTALSTPVSLTFTYQSGTDGEYIAVIPYTAVIVDGKNYILKIDANAGANMIGHWEFRCVARARSE